MSVSNTINIKQTLYPQERVGPLGEIGFWSFLVSIAGDAGGGTSVLVATWTNTTNKLGFSVMYLDYDTSEETARQGELTLAYRSLANDSLRVLMLTTAVGSLGSAQTLGGSRWDPRSVFYPVTLRDAIVTFANPNVTLTTANTNGVTNTLRGVGYLFPHMMLQQQPSRVPRIGLVG